MVDISLFSALGLLCLVAGSTGNQCLRTIPPQLERLRSGETQPSDAAASEMAFDVTILSTINRPRSLPTREQTVAEYEKYKQRVEGGGGTTDVGSVNLYARYYQRSFWYGRRLGCCPRTQSYGCRSYRRPLPCHSIRVLGRIEWCCPFWPSFPSLYIANCNCQECSILSSSCVTKGTCRRRSVWRSYYAICYRSGSWSTIRRLGKALPSSCYCRP